MAFWLRSVPKNASALSALSGWGSEKVFQTIRKLADTEFQYHRGVFKVYISTFLQKSVFFFFLWKETLHWLMRCNSNITKLVKLTLLSFDCKAWALKWASIWKRSTYVVFLSSFSQLQLKQKIPHFFSKFFLQNISYPKSSINLCD